MLGGNNRQLYESYGVIYNSGRRVTPPHARLGGVLEAVGGCSGGGTGTKQFWAAGGRCVGSGDALWGGKWCLTAAWGVSTALLAAGGGGACGLDTWCVRRCSGSCGARTAGCCTYKKDGWVVGQLRAHLGWRGCSRVGG